MKKLNIRKVLIILNNYRVKKKTKNIIKITPMNNIKTESFSDKYKLMIYFAHSTLVIYSKSIVCDSKTTVEEFKAQNKDVIKRVFDEGLSIFNYELSAEQMDRAIIVYGKSLFTPLDVTKTEVYNPNY